MEFTSRRTKAGLPEGGQRRRDIRQSINKLIAENDDAVANEVVKKIRQRRRGSSSQISSSAGSAFTRNEDALKKLSQGRDMDGHSNVFGSSIVPLKSKKKKKSKSEDMLVEHFLRMWSCYENSCSPMDGSPDAYDDDDDDKEDDSVAERRNDHVRVFGSAYSLEEASDSDDASSCDGRPLSPRTAIQRLLVNPPMCFQRQQQLAKFRPMGSPTSMPPFAMEALQRSKAIFEQAKEVVKENIEQGSEEIRKQAQRFRNDDDSDSSESESDSEYEGTFDEDSSEDEESYDGDFEVDDDPVDDEFEATFRPRKQKKIVAVTPPRARKTRKHRRETSRTNAKVSVKPAWEFHSPGTNSTKSTSDMDEGDLGGEPRGNDMSSRSRRASMSIVGQTRNSSSTGRDSEQEVREKEPQMLVPPNRIPTRSRGSVLKGFSSKISRKGLSRANSSPTLGMNREKQSDDVGHETSRSSSGKISKFRRIISSRLKTPSFRRVKSSRESGKNDHSLEETPILVVNKYNVEEEVEVLSRLSNPKDADEGNNVLNQLGTLLSPILSLSGTQSDKQSLRFAKNADGSVMSEMKIYEISYEDLRKLNKDNDGELVKLRRSPVDLDDIEARMKDGMSVNSETVILSYQPPAPSKEKPADTIAPPALRPTTAPQRVQSDITDGTSTDSEESDSDDESGTARSSLYDDSWDVSTAPASGLFEVASRAASTPSVEDVWIAEKMLDLYGKTTGRDVDDVVEDVTKSMDSFEKKLLMS